MVFCTMRLFFEILKGVFVVPSWGKVPFSYSKHFALFESWAGRRLMPFPACSIFRWRDWVLDLCDVSMLRSIFRQPVSNGNFLCISSLNSFWDNQKIGKINQELYTWTIIEKPQNTGLNLQKTLKVTSVARNCNTSLGIRKFASFFKKMFSEKMFSEKVISIKNIVYKNIKSNKNIT